MRFIIFFLFPILLNAQIGAEIQFSKSDTVYIQYLSKNISNVTQEQFEATKPRLSFYKDSIEYKTFILNEKIRFVVKYWGQEPNDVLKIVKHLYPDAFFIDKNGWRIK